MVTQRLKRYRDELQAHYTRSNEIVSYMVAKLQPSEESLIWEPCAGGGDLIDGVLEVVPFAHIHASEIDASAANALEKRFGKRDSINVVVEDALNFSSNSLFSQKQIDRIIANPPYGAWQEKERRQLLKRQFPNLYVKDTYAVFLYHCLDQLASTGRLVFIMPETFLWLHRHEFLRRHLFSNFSVEEIALFPSKFFPGISFGYAGLCILTVVNRKPEPQSKIRIFRSLKTPSVLLELSEGNLDPAGCERMEVDQLSSLSNEFASLVLDSEERKTIKASDRITSLGEIASVVTGFYSGNDRHWLRKVPGETRTGKHIEQIDFSQVYVDEDTPPPLDGLEGEKCFIPIMRGGGIPFFKPTNFYVDWSKKAISEYRKKGPNPARFQNAQYYFRQGIGVPMVKSSRMSAALIDNRVFDQGIVGIFPQEEKFLFFLLGFLNTDLATRLTMAINPTANNSANYLKRLPIVMPQQNEIERANELVNAILMYRRIGETVPEALIQNLEDFFAKIWEEAV